MTRDNIPKKRLPFIDLMKGLCIILIVIGHVDTALFTALGDNADRMFQTFRVPMYYFVSGIFFKQYGGFFDFARKKVNNILIPFAFFYLFAYLVQMAFHYMPACSHVFGEFHRGSIIQPLTQRYWDCNVPLWFLMSLFWVNILYYLLQMITRRRWVQILAVAAMAAVGYTLCAWHIRPLYYIDTALVGMPFFVLGSLLREQNVLRPSSTDKWGLVAFPLALVLTYFLAGEIDIYRQILPSGLVLYGLSSIAIVALLWCSKNIGSVPGVNYLGRYSIVVLGTHYVFIPIVRALLTSITELDGLASSLVTLLIVLALMFPTIALFIRVFPRFTAQREFFKPGWRL